MDWIDFQRAAIDVERAKRPLRILAAIVKGFIGVALVAFALMFVGAFQ